jgi:two-component system, NtrC family, sensor kinase
MSRPSMLFRPLGLRAEVIANLCLLLAAALMISGLLLLRITEREVLGERVSRLVDLTRAIGGPAGEQATREARGVISAFQGLPPDLALESVLVVDREGSPVARHGHPGLDGAELRRVIAGRAADVRVVYPEFWLPLGAGEERFVLITIPLLDGRERVTGALQARFSLATVRGQVVDAQKLVLLTMGTAWLLFVLIGLLLLSRSVIGPVRRLKAATARIAQGELGHGLPEQGPREIAELAAAFNTMSNSLKESREQTAETITSLQEANETLARTRQELIRSERMASVGHLAAGMAHEIGNPLGAAVGYLDLLKRETPTDHGQDLCRRTQEELDRIDRLVRDLLDYASPKRAVPEELDPADVAAEAVQLLENQGVFDSIQVDVVTADHRQKVRMERHKLTQLLVNLLLNARDALGGKEGAIMLKTEGLNGEVLLSVQDNGMGMAPDVSAHIFDPFFTTKAPGQGRGLGLSVCHRIIEEAGGSIDVESTPAKGSVFRIRLPGVRQEERKNGDSDE